MASIVTELASRIGLATGLAASDNKCRGQVEYFFRWQDEQARVISEGEHVTIVIATENTPKKWKPTG